MKIIKKIFTVLIIACLLTTVMPLDSLQNVKANVGASDSKFTLTNEEQEKVEKSLNDELVTELDTKNNEELAVEVADVSSDSVVVETTYEDDENEAKFELEFSFETDEIIMKSEYLEEGQLVEGEFEIEILELNEDSYVFNFIDLNTREEYMVDSTQIEASALPVIVYFIGSQVARITVQHIGKKAILKIGKKTFQAKSKNAAKKATVNFSNVTIKAGGKNVYFTKAKMQHILQNHHPSYWTGKSGKSMFDPSLSVNQVKNIVTNVINSNKTTIGNALKKGNSVNVYKTINGIKYKVNIGKDGYVKSAYPV
ncbi:SAR2788 family putative toxin [Niallia circulans]|jgi:hypothetical protein|uniref:SAR2788 family putative toxin n=1 Tax=Niallia circulans TaxID=1397 RepID=UPI00352F3934